jgi:hypothetical protein
MKPSNWNNLDRRATQVALDYFNQSFVSDGTPGLLAPTPNFDRWDLLFVWFRDEADAMQVPSIPRACLRVANEEVLKLAAEEGEWGDSTQDEIQIHIAGIRNELRQDASTLVGQLTDQALARSRVKDKTRRKSQSRNERKEEDAAVEKMMRGAGIRPVRKSGCLVFLFLPFAAIWGFVF